jgi:hypothetical protein
VYNILGILRKGMCIAPKEANGSGTNFGKGRTTAALSFFFFPIQITKGSHEPTRLPAAVYFADFPEKSVSYMSSDHGKVRLPQ